MRKRVGVAIAVLAIAWTTAFPSSSSAAKLGVELFGGWASYAMGDFNDSLQVLNQDLGTQFDDITSGGTGGLSLRVWPTENVLLRGTLEAMLAETEDSGVTFDIGPVALLGSMTYFFPTTGPIKLGLGGGIGWYSITGSLKGPAASFDTSGDGWGVHGMGEAMVPLGTHFSVWGNLGYRYAKVNDVKLDLGGGSASLDTEADFSGMLLRIGVAFEGTFH